MAMYQELRNQIQLHFRIHPTSPNLLVVELPEPDDWRNTAHVGLMSQDGDRWHSVDEADERHLESSVMLDVAYGLLVKRLDEEGAVMDWVEELYPFVDYSSIYQNEPHTLKIFSRDQKLLIETTCMTLEDAAWVGMNLIGRQADNDIVSYVEMWQGMKKIQSTVPAP